MFLRQRVQRRCWCRSRRILRAFEGGRTTQVEAVPCRAQRQLPQHHSPYTFSFLAIGSREKPRTGRTYKKISFGQEERETEAIKLIGVAMAPQIICERVETGMHCARACR